MCVCVCLTSCFSWNSDMSIRMKPCIKERQNLVICPSREANNYKRRLIYWLTFLMSLCMYRATCLASSVLPAKTIKHLFASMQFISSNNKTRNARNITAVTWQSLTKTRVVLTHYDATAASDAEVYLWDKMTISSQGERLLHAVCLFYWRLVACVSVISPSLHSSLRVM